MYVGLEIVFNARGNVNVIYGKQVSRKWTEKREEYCFAQLTNSSYKKECICLSGW